MGTMFLKSEIHYFKKCLGTENSCFKTCVLFPKAKLARKSQVDSHFCKGCSTTLTIEECNCLQKNFLGAPKIKTWGNPFCFENNSSKTRVIIGRFQVANLQFLAASLVSVRVRPAKTIQTVQPQRQTRSNTCGLPTGVVLTRRRVGVGSR